MYDRLRKKYYWRDWLVVVYSDMSGSKYHWRNACNKDTTTLDLIHWKGRYNILISSVPSDKRAEPFTVNARIKTTYKKKNRHAKNGYIEHSFDAKKIFEELPADARSCKYPLKGVVKTDLYRHKKVALRAPENRKFHQKGPRIEIFVLG